MDRLKLATTWLGGCSGCHMSFLDLDEWLIELSQMADLVYGPFVDTKVFPNDVDLTLVEGAVANEDHVTHLQVVRRQSRAVIAFGDCAVTGNVTACRNSLGGAQPVLHRAYIELATIQPIVPDAPGVLPRLLDRVRPVHEVVPIDGFLPGCPPPAERIRLLLEALLTGGTPHLEGQHIKFG